MSAKISSLHVGGDFEGTRLNAALAERLSVAGIAATLDPLFVLFAAERVAGEGFGDFCHRLGIAALRAGIVGRAVARRSIDQSRVACRMG